MWPKPPAVGRYTIERLPLYVPPIDKPVLPTMSITVKDSRIKNVFVSVLSPALAPPALEMVGSFPKIGVICEREDRTDELVVAKQRVSIVEIFSNSSTVGDYLPECVCFPIMDRLPSEEETNLASELERKIQNIVQLPEGELLKPHRDPYESIMNMVSEQYLLDREMFGFAVASRFDLTLAEYLALLNTVDGVGRLEWLYWHAVTKVGRRKLI